MRVRMGKGRDICGDSFVDGESGSSDGVGVENIDCGGS